MISINAQLYYIWVPVCVFFFHINTHWITFEFWAVFNGKRKPLATCITALLQIHLWLFQFFLGTDDGHRVVLKSISDGVDCEHDYINATYIDVRSLKMYGKVLSQTTTTWNSTSYIYLPLILRILNGWTVVMLFCCTQIHLTLRVILKGKSTLPPKVKVLCVWKTCDMQVWVQSCTASLSAFTVAILTCSVYSNAVSIYVQTLQRSKYTKR